MSNLSGALALIGVFLMLVGLSSCAGLDKTLDGGAEKVADAISKYCASVDEDKRQAFRAEINSRMPHRIAVTCK